METQTKLREPGVAPFDRSRLRVLPLAAREHKLGLDGRRKLDAVEMRTPALRDVAAAMLDARAREASVILMLGGHVIRAGVQAYLIDLMERGFVSCIALNGAGLIHDYEFALAGASTEDVQTYLRSGQFGLWRETGEINEIAKLAASRNAGLGETAGQLIAEGDFPRREASLLAAAYRLGIPVTVHVGIGYDIVYEHPNCDGAAWGAASYHDFLRFASVVENLEGGVVGTFGCAVMAPEVFLKALAMARNVAHQAGGRIADFDSLVCDLMPVPQPHSVEPSPDEPAYYFRPLKTLLIRSVADGGRGHYVRGSHANTIPELWTQLQYAEEARARATDPEFAAQETSTQ
ncbi:MAG: hypothetical protein QF570_09225 [Myxococcota bacterium]|jgi:hypothetical protein|nr:hypothetical protein [Myxococcota bacterium]